MILKNKYVPDSHMTNHSSRKYDDIINLPHPESSSHVRMPLHDRAAQFAPFAALTGHGKAIQNTAEAMEDEMKLGKDVTLLEDPADPALWACSNLRLADNKSGETCLIWLKYTTIYELFLQFHL